MPLKHIKKIKVYKINDISCFIYYSLWVYVVIENDNINRYINFMIINTCIYSIIYLYFKAQWSYYYGTLYTSS